MSDDTLKICVVGSGGVGKSACTVRFCQGHFVAHYDPTIEDSYRKSVEIDGKHYRTEILDTAGTEAFSAMRDLYYKDGEGFVLVYSLTARSTFQDVQDMRDAIVRAKDSEAFCSFLVANKADLPENEWMVPREEGQALAAKWRGCQYIETSAKEDKNIQELFTGLMRQMIAKRNGKNGNAEAANHKKQRHKKQCILF